VYILPLLLHTPLLQVVQLVLVGCGGAGVELGVEHWGGPCEGPQ
jgi:hypothetical protein